NWRGPCWWRRRSHCPHPRPLPQAGEGTRSCRCTNGASSPTEREKVRTKGSRLGAEKEGPESHPRKKRPGWQRRAIRASRAKGGSFRAELGQSKIDGRAGRRRRLQVAVARPVETGGTPRRRAGVSLDTPLSDVSSDHCRTPCLTCRPTVARR